ncbi:TetR/AcrR family transcriptional regulator [Acerihabitans arboris]|uniref:TetR family transcriptional regulator n=1 Tax=Acerihabitans arboris TaxID=2691583 RepID=A0A845SLJ0_9GAMM|nr:TetR/AcrR family transcriptional regulator [Acerihabitans arboris]NDL63844.1 TetR family transcriptional regulator [Acerihabitans arboris]
MDTHPPACVKTTKGPGRPKLFDRENALDKALVLFWRHGYEATSMSDLVAATGAKAPTLYTEFGNKEGLFRAAAERYIELFAERGKNLLADTARPVAGVLWDYLRDAAAMFTDDALPAGCFLICTSAALSSSSNDVALMLRARHHRQEDLLLAFFRQRQAMGELPGDMDAAGLAKNLVCALHGMSVQAREGASRDDLHAIAATWMTVWPALALPKGPTA